VPPTKVAVQVDWLKPFQARNLNEFTIHSQRNETEVTWSIRASNLYPMKVVGIFVNLESAFGKHMDATLKNLKNLAERREPDPVNRGS